LPSEAFETFRKSMSIGYEEWHDGIGYDLNALAEMDENELSRAEDLVVARNISDWRDVEALDRIGSDRALGEVKKALGSTAIEVQIPAAECLARRNLIAEEEVEGIIVEALDHATILNGMVATLRFATAHPTPAVSRKLMWCALHGHDDLRVHAAALAHFLSGGSSSEFDWAFRPFYLRFADKEMHARKSAFMEFCAMTGVDPLMIDSGG